MGVTGLWTVVQPCARPIKIETLNRKRLAVDASIWVYQFLKAVRDKEGNALRNSHVVGFFRRICKLLFFGILPVFVFDGGAPVLKRQTVAGRRARREGRREDAVRTAGKLLALQMHRRAEEDEAERKRALHAPAQKDRDEEPLPENLVYVDELNMTEKERQQNRKFKRKDQYHLPELDVPLSEMGAPDDPRVMSMAELENYARQFESGEDINVYDFSKIDFNSPFFTSLPASDRYNILNAARLRSRLRMGHSKDQLDKMFPDRMAFSRFQIERVAERNELTQRLMNVNGMGDDPVFDGNGRVAGEKGREYVLVKNPGVEGGWALGVIGDRDKEEGERTKPIDIEELERREKEKEDGSEDLDAEQEAEGLSQDEIERRRQAFYNSRRDAVTRKRRRSNESDEVAAASQDDQYDDPDALFVGDAKEAAAASMLQAESDYDSEEDAQLQRAIAMSLGQDNEESEDGEASTSFDPATFKQQRAADFNPFAKASGKFAQVANNRSRRVAPAPEKEASDDENDLASALAESRRSLGKATSRHGQPGSGFPRIPTATLPPVASQEESGHKKDYSGPLPFEKLDLGTSLLGKKKMQQMEQQKAGEAGGFVKPGDEEKKPAAPLPPWFRKEDAVEKDHDAQKAVEDEDRRREREASDDRRFQFESKPTLNKQHTNQVIDVDALGTDRQEIIDLEAEQESDATVESLDAGHGVRTESPPRMSKVAEEIRGDIPPLLQDLTVVQRRNRVPFEDSSEAGSDEGKSADWPESENGHQNEGQEDKNQQTTSHEMNAIQAERLTSESSDDVYIPNDLKEVGRSQRSDPIYSLANSESNSILGPGQNVTGALSAILSKQKSPLLETAEQPEKHNLVKDADTNDSREGSPDDLYIPDASFFEEENDGAATSATNHVAASNPILEDTNEEQPANEFDFVGADEEEEAAYSDPEDEELMISLANEAEEHARFASTFNQKSQRQNIEEYEQELKALRTQQKKDRRDADEVTQVMITECQQLLKMFGLPYITAPMEAEAQCAELVRLGLVDGIVTDDSDTFLFGGTRIYKNMFNQAKFVECYLAADLEKEFDLTRDKLVRIAHLLGSDYTEGLPGIGPVTALEIISEFPEGLEEFKEWWDKVQNGTRLAKEDAGFRKKFRKSNATKLFLPTAFPDHRVDVAYLNPEVDSDPSPFQWGVPDLDALRSFLMATIGWSPDRTDEVLVPVIRDMNRRDNEGTQANITQFITGQAGAGAFAPRVRGEGKSKRMEGALERMAERAKRKRRGAEQQEAQVHVNEEVEILSGNQQSPTQSVQAPAASKSKAPAAGRRSKQNMKDMAADDEDENREDGDVYEPATKKRRKGRKPKTA